MKFSPLNAELNPICHLLALLGGATIVVASRLGVNKKFKIVNAPHGYISPMVHSHYDTESVTVGSA